LTALDGGKVRLSEFRGKPVLLSFFAFGCGPCRTETPHISYLAEQHRGDGLVVLAVNAWDEPKEILQQYIEQNNFQQRVLLDGAEVFQRYNIPSERIPTVVWIDRQGMIVDTSVGATNPDHLYRTTRALINGKS
jgi:thiol-disulfide isomerase/thioredoxin